MGKTEREVAAALAKHFGVRPELFIGTRDYLNGTLKSLLRIIRAELASKKAKEEQMETVGVSEVKLTYAEALKIVKGLSPETFEMEKSELEAYVCEQLGISEWDRTAKYAQRKSFAKFIKSCKPKVRKVVGQRKQKLKVEMQFVKEEKELCDRCKLPLGERGVCDICHLRLGPVRTVEDDTKGGWIDTSEIVRKKRERKEHMELYRKQRENAVRTIQQMARAKLALMKEKRRLEKVAEYAVLLERQKEAEARLQASMREAREKDEEENRRFDVEVGEMIDENLKEWLEKFNKSWKGNRGKWANGRSQEAVDEFVRLYEKLSAFVVESGFMERGIDFGVIEEMTQEIDHVVTLVKRLIDDFLQIVKLKWESPTGRVTLKKVKKGKKGKKSAAKGELPLERKMKFPKVSGHDSWRLLQSAIETWTSSKHSSEANLIDQAEEGVVLGLC